LSGLPRFAFAKKKDFPEDPNAGLAPAEAFFVRIRIAASGLLTGNTPVEKLSANATHPLTACNRMKYPAFAKELHKEKATIAGVEIFGSR